MIIIIIMMAIIIITITITIIIIVIRIITTIRMIIAIGLQVYYSPVTFFLSILLSFL